MRPYFPVGNIDLAAAPHTVRLPTKTTFGVFGGELGICRGVEASVPKYAAIFLCYCNVHLCRLYSTCCCKYADIKMCCFHWCRYKVIWYWFYCCGCKLSLNKTRAMRWPAHVRTTRGSSWCKATKREGRECRPKDAQGARGLMKILLKKSRQLCATHITAAATASGICATNSTSKKQKQAVDRKVRRRAKNPAISP